MPSPITLVALIIAALLTTNLVLAFAIPQFDTISWYMNTANHLGTFGLSVYGYGGNNGGVSYASGAAGRVSGSTDAVIAGLVGIICLWLL
jgi:uncharacterized membrane protein